MTRDIVLSHNNNSVMCHTTGPDTWITKKLKNKQNKTTN